MWWLRVLKVGSSSPYPGQKPRKLRAAAVAFASWWEDHLKIKSLLRNAQWIQLKFINSTAALKVEEYLHLSIDSDLATNRELPTEYVVVH